ncbi:hypothetical protein ACQW02_17020 [Humitalea sp. 24SJ18S-53]|uniref:hypothetical protein n=1 Tax=Humitalea sp. 24SJ18S-53 TaxID=3422307 RepID=UPI003D66C82C
MTPIHIRPGDDLRGRLPPGDYLTYADPVCLGPARDADGPMAWLAQRSRFVAMHAHHPLEAVRLRLGAEYTALLAAARGDAPLHIWCEHDVWDQIALLRIISLIWPAGRGRIFLMPADGRRVFPALTDAELAALVPVPLGDAAAEAACLAWDAFAGEDPAELDRIWRRQLPFPHLAPALRRHLQDLPWASDGLALSERRVLRAVVEGAADAAAVLAGFAAADPVFHPTDLMVAEIIDRLRHGTRRLIARSGPLALSPLGQAVLAGQARHAPAPRFVGGIAVGPTAPAWWDPGRAGVVTRPNNGLGAAPGGLSALRGD